MSQREKVILSLIYMKIIKYFHHQGHTQSQLEFEIHDGLELKDVLSKYEVNLYINYKVIANNKKKGNKNNSLF
jgi:hypothetical protein